MGGAFWRRWLLLPYDLSPLMASIRRHGSSEEVLWGKPELLLLDYHSVATQAMWRPLWRRENEKRKEKSRSPIPRLPALLPRYSTVSQSICPDVCAALGSQSCWQKGLAPEGAEISPTSYTHPEPTSGLPCT